MRTLKNYIDKPTKVKVEVLPPPCPPPQDDQVHQGERNIPRELYHAYAAIQKRHGMWVVPFEGDQRMRTCFKKLAARFAIWAEQGVDIEVGLYMAAHKDQYGKELRPHHLLGRYSLDIYATAMEVRRAEEVILTAIEQAQYDEHILADLASLHDESPETIAALLVGCGFL